jgi:hypothetical protein
VALSPSIPTSFVPKQPVSTGRRRYSSTGNSVLLFIAVCIFCASLAAADGLTAKLAIAQKQADPSTIAEFTRLKNRFLAANQLISQHVVLTHFLVFLGSVTIQNVSFTAIDVLIADDHSAKLTLQGSAKTFNALESESAVFATQKAIKSAVFSAIVPQKDGTVSFAVSANLDPSIITDSSAPLTATTLPASLPSVPVPTTRITPTSVASASTTSTVVATSTPKKP